MIMKSPATLTAPIRASLRDAQIKGQAHRREHSHNANAHIKNIAVFHLSNLGFTKAQIHHESVYFTCHDQSLSY